MDVKRFRLIHGLSTRDIVMTLKSEYPKYSKITHCMVEHPSSYGVKLVPEAEQLLMDRLALVEGRGGDRHRNRHRLSFRATKAFHSEVKQAVEADGRYGSVSELLYTLTAGWLKRKKKAAPGGNDTKDGSTGKQSDQTITQEGGAVNAPCDG